MPLIFFNLSNFPVWWLPTEHVKGILYWEFHPQPTHSIRYSSAHQLTYMTPLKHCKTTLQSNSARHRFWYWFWERTVIQKASLHKLTGLVSLVCFFYPFQMSRRKCVDSDWTINTLQLETTIRNNAVTDVQRLQFQINQQIQSTVLTVVSTDLQFHASYRHTFDCNAPTHV